MNQLNKKDILCYLVVILIFRTCICGQPRDTNTSWVCGLETLKPLPQTSENLQRWQEFERHYTSVISSGKLFNRRANYTLPVVFHVVHENGAENIPDQQILNGLNYLNQAFANLGYFDRGTGVNTNIDFCIAKQDPEGIPTNGITRTISLLTELDAANDLDLKSIIHWDPISYINIYLVRSICDGPSCDIAGYAYLPNHHGMPDDGIVIEAEYIGNDESKTSVLIHEMGHYLGLYHTFYGGCQNNNCLLDGDRVCDTPPDRTSVPANCILPPNSCSTDEDDVSTNNPFRALALGGLGDQADMVENYMDYSDLRCFSAFTQGQSVRMSMAIKEIRSSLQQSVACQSPCPNPTIISIIPSDVLLNVGTNQLFESVIQNASSVEWTINGVFETMATSFNKTFNEEGIYEIILFGKNNDALCTTISDTTIVTVACQTQATFEPRIYTCIPIDTIIHFNNTSTSSTEFMWYVDGNFYSSEQDINYTFDISGTQEINLIVIGPTCNDTLSHKFYIDCNESCDNGFDDDGDLLVDQYDPDCCDFNPTYSFFCDSFCPAIQPFNTEMELAWISSVGTTLDETPAVGDIDADGNTEVICVSEFDHIVIFDGTTGEAKLIFPSRSRLEGGIAIADMDNDGYGEILAVTEGGYVECYDHDGTFKYVNNSKIPLEFPNFEERYDGAYPSIADFNQDGLPEFYIGNQIFNGQNGALLIKGGNNSNGVCTRCSSGNAWQKFATVAVDIIPDDFCNSCQGLELVAGNQIYAVDIDNQTWKIISEQASLRDAFTAVVDFDLDGDLDVVGVTTIFEWPNINYKLLVYAWDGQTDELLGKLEVEYNNGSVTEPVVGNFDDDALLEIGFHAYRGLVVIDDDFTIKWSKRLSDGSATTALGFDFDTDGKLELVYRDDISLGIYDGATGATLASFPISSSTSTENMAIADVDGDQSAEIVLYGDITPPFIGGLHCIGTESLPAWPNTRPVYNQSNFYNVNINDDLSVPIQMQQHHLVGDLKILNNFRTPLAIPTSSIDISIDSLKIICTGDRQLSMQICNQASEIIAADMNISLYCENPMLPISQPIQTFLLNQSIQPGECIEHTITFTFNCTSDLYAVANDDGSLIPPFDIGDFPITTIPECNYENNIAFIPIRSFSSNLHLGEDKTWCPATDQLELNATNKFEQYLWDDGSTDSIRIVNQLGIYWVEVTDTCGFSIRDTIEILDYLSTLLDLGNDTSICENAIVVFDAGTNYEHYTWDNRSLEQSTTAWYSGTYSVTVEDACGLVQSDEIVLTVIDAPSLALGTDTTICAGDSLIFQLENYSIYQWAPDSNILCIDCDSTIVFPNQSTTYHVLAQDENGCFVSDSVQILVEHPPFSSLTHTLCTGESINVAGQWISTPGQYSFRIPSDARCDSLVILDLSFYEKVILETSATDTISENGIVDLSVLINGQDPNQVNWFPMEIVNCPTCPTTVAYPNVTTDFIIVARDQNNCPYYDTIHVHVLIPSDTYVPTAFSPNNDGINDIFYVHAEHDQPITYTITIFSRWGNKVYERKNCKINDAEVGWDGYFKNKLVDEGVYIYHIELLNNGVLEQVKGAIHVVR